ncbi:MAG: ATP-binding cassette domain-containing protein [Pseudomonadota bacterium]
MLTLDRLRFERPGFSLDADWSLSAGARVAVIGPSGGGKSTLMSLIAGFEQPASGAVRFDGTDLSKLRPGSRPISILFQEGNLFPHLSVAQNVGLGVSPSLRLTREDHARIAGVLERVGISEMGARKPGALSGGQRARVALARVLLRARPILLLDEAFSALGPALKSEMFELLDEILEPQTIVLMVTHDPGEAARMADIVVVDAGIAAPPEPAKELLATPNAALARYLGT